MATVGITDQLGNAAHQFLHLASVASLHHGKKIIRPIRQMARAMIAMADKFQRTNLFAQLIHLLIRDIPYRHAICLVTQSVMVWNHANTANHPSFKHTPHAHHNFFSRNAYLPCNRVIRLRFQWQSGLGGKDDTTIDLVKRCFKYHSVNFSPTKYSLILGMSYTGYPVFCSIFSSAITCSRGVSVASTNHMLSIWSRS